MQLEKRESTGTGEKKLYTGIFSARVVAINASSEDRANIIGYEVKPDEKGEVKQPSYEEKDKDGNEVVIVNFLLEGTEADKGKFFDARFRITDKEATNKDGSKYQYVNATGDSSYADSESNLLDWWTHYQEETEKGSKVYKNVGDKPYRKALQGEADLMNFMKAWLSKAKITSGDGILLNTKALFRNVNKYVASELRPEITKDDSENVTDTVVCLATVYSKEKDGEIKHHQNIYKEYLPGYSGYTMKQVSTAVNSGWDKVEMKGLKKWYKAIQGEYGPRDSYTLGLLQPFSAENHIQATTETMRVDTSTEVSDTEY